MKNKKLKYGSLASVCLLLLALLPASCIKDDYAATDKATVTVTFTTRAISGNSNTDAETLETYEHMRTLRVIVARATTGDILYNVKYDIAEDEKQKTITFSELTVNADGENFDFYAIANEVGTEYSDWESVSVETLNSRSLSNIATLNGGNTLIPQTAKATIHVVPGNSDDTTIQLQFAVAKVRLTINNTSTESQTVSDIKLSGVNMTSTPLFAGESLSTANRGFVNLGNMEISGMNSETVYAYFYENQNSSGYNLTAYWKKDQTLPLQTGSDDNKQSITEIPRGKMLDINVNLSVNTEPTVNVQVVSWTTKEMDVPAFQ